MSIIRSFGLHVGQRFHAATHELLKSSDRADTKATHAVVSALFEQHGLESDEARKKIILQVIKNIADAFGLDRSKLELLADLVGSLFHLEQLFILPEIDWTEKRTVAEWWALRDELKRQQSLFTDYPGSLTLIQEVITNMLEPIYKGCPALARQDNDQGDIIVPSPLIHLLGNTGEVVEAMLGPLFSDRVAEANLFPNTSERINRNIVSASGGDPADINGFTGVPILPSQSKIFDPQELASTYLTDSPLWHFLQQDVAFAIPTKTRFEHHHIVAGTGHGKTQTLQYLIGEDLNTVAKGGRSVVVIDSQGDLIKTISNLAEFGPDGPLHDRLVIIDPTDVEYPVSLNLFDVGMERLQGYAPLERERLTNSILELYDFVLGSLLDAGMTQKQNVIFRYVTRLMLHIPNATIHTLRELLEEGGKEKFTPFIAKLEGSAQHFFNSEFDDKEFKQTKRQVLRRLWGILENQTFERMFSHPKSKLDLFSELNAGKVILINTAKDLLKEQGTQVFGRFFIALITQAAQERATLVKKDRIPTIVYIDEAQEYFDRNIETILAQARKYNVGLVLAHQYLGQLDPKLQEAFGANTSIKFAGGVSTKDAKTLAPMLHTEPDVIEQQGKGRFASHIRGVTPNAVPLQFPFGVLENKPRLSKEEQHNLRDQMRTKYAVHYSEIKSALATSATATDKPADAETIIDKKAPPKGNSLDNIDLTPTATW